ncbi:leucine-rich repeat domain-containing protein [Chryseobacterium tongliaoense]|uniref:leucine-rich repeat domain-containing protein n=1 Tax=Chryseobacterium tongliaoense TaxID=3240933 RepID=UPI00351308D6
MKTIFLPGQKNTFFCLFTLLLFCFTQAQIVNIPDANFKNALIAKGIDTNNDGEIQVTEAQAIVNELNIVDKNIADLTGIKSFTNLKILNCLKNNLTTLDLSGMINLIQVSCSENNLTTLNLNGLVNVVNLYCGVNDLTSLDLGSMTSLQHAYCSENNLISINLNGATNLRYLYLNDNQLTSINLDGLIYLKYLDLGANQFSSLQINNLPSLEIFDFGNNNQPASLNLSVLPNIKTVRASNSKLTSINSSGLQTLKILNCSDNQLNSLSFQDGFLQNLQYLNVTNNPIQFICKDSYDLLTNTNPVPQLINACILATQEVINEQAKIIIYPNPAKEYINLNPKAKEIKIFSLEGKIVLNKKDNKESKINISNLPIGVYIVKTELGSTKFIKK